jgi:hypothetical protein
MDDDVIIRANNVSMEFNLSQEKTDNLKEYFIKVLKRELRFQSFWALKDISFEINRGDKIGCIGVSGTSFAPHLHYEVIRDTVVMDPVNHFFASFTPEEYVNVMIMAATTGQSLD